MSHRVRTREWSGIDYYTTLGVSSDATGAEIDEAYRRLALELHPDRNRAAGAEGRTKEARFKEVATAYSALRDPVTRMAYDEFRMRIDTGTLYEVRRERPGAPPAPRRPVAAPGRPRRRPMPDWLRATLAAALLVAGLAAAVWAVVGAEGSTAGDTPLAVRITLAIMAAKLVVCGGIVLWYPRLRARWMPPART